MPIYEYRCTGCDEVTEVIHKVGEGPLRKCRKCGDKLEKLVSRAAFQLKGGGWFNEGYGSGGKKESSTSSSSSSSSSKKSTKKSSGGSKTGD